MRDLAGAEHSLHWLLAKDGARTVYPKLTHADAFAQTKEILQMTQEIADGILANKV